MSEVTVRYFANLRERMGRADEKVALDGGKTTVADLWAQLSGGEAIPANILIAVNMEYKDASTELKGGDEVAFFPPVTGG
jgi:molybdopterin converting factor subunit 1